jgi:ADP-ribose pyrophosphatase YjhB (NUDIX family)
MRTIGANVAVLQDGKVLLTRREDFQVWCLPGGHVEPGESLAQAAIREVLEETGLDVRLTRLVGLYSRPRWGEYHIAVFAAESVGGSLHGQAGEVIDLAYFGRNGLPETLMVGHRQRIDAVDR